MKREMNGKIVMIVTAVMLCFAGCGMEAPVQEDSSIVSENLTETERMEEPEDVGTHTQEQEMKNDSVEQNVVQTDLDVSQTKQDDENVDRLLEWIMSEEGQYIIEETGYVGVSSN